MAKVFQKNDRFRVIEISFEGCREIIDAGMFTFLDSLKRQAKLLKLSLDLRYIDNIRSEVTQELQALGFNVDAGKEDETSYNPEIFKELLEVIRG